MTELEDIVNEIKRIGGKRTYSDWSTILGVTRQKIAHAKSKMKLSDEYFIRREYYAEYNSRPEVLEKRRLRYHKRKEMGLTKSKAYNRRKRNLEDCRLNYRKRSVVNPEYQSAIRKARYANMSNDQKKKKTIWNRSPKAKQSREKFVKKNEEQLRFYRWFYKWVQRLEPEFREKEKRLEWRKK